jgi:hypothetical protein
LVGAGDFLLAVTSEADMLSCPTGVTSGSYRLSFN